MCGSSCSTHSEYDTDKYKQVLKFILFYIRDVAFKGFFQIFSVTLTRFYNNQNDIIPIIIKQLGIVLKRVLVIRCGALGDLVYATSVVDALKMEFGEDTLIDFVCTPGSGTLFKNDTRVNRVFPLKHKKIPLLLSAQKRAIVRASKEKPYDILINFEFGKQFKTLLESVVADKKVGAQFEDLELNQEINRGELQKEYCKSIISKDVLSTSFPRVISAEFTPLKNKFALSDSYIVIAPSNSHVNRGGINYRAWDSEKWRELIAKLSQEIQVLIVGAKGEERYFSKIAPYPHNVVDLVGKNNVAELSSIIENAKATICTDSAVGHISAATNTSVFILMGPNNTITDTPYKTPHNAVHPISLHLECSPCYKTDVMKKCRDNICMKNISAAMVYDKLKELL